jgi:hypothetical protein
LPLEQPRSKTKVVTKAALAKKILKKKIQANQVNNKAFLTFSCLETSLTSKNYSLEIKIR